MTRVQLIGGAVLCLALSVFGANINGQRPSSPAESCELTGVLEGMANQGGYSFEYKSGFTPSVDS